jgi:hypothetical protein
MSSVSRTGLVHLSHMSGLPFCLCNFGSIHLRLAEANGLPLSLLGHVHELIHDNLLL